MALEQTPPPKRSLGLWMSTALVVGNMIGSGIFLLPASLGAYGGISIIGWLFTSLGAIVLALVFSRLSKMMPKTGGPYIYIQQAYGDFAGFLIAWGYWISILATNAAISVAFVSYLTVFWPALATNSLLAAGVALTILWSLTLVNSLGIRNAGFVQLTTTILKLVPLVLIATFGLLYFDVENLKPFNASGESPFSAITATATLTLWAFVGLESATIPADDVRNPERTISRATILGTLICAAVYILSTIAIMGVIPSAALATSSAPFADAASVMWGGWASYAVAAGAVISCFGALNGWILMQGQMPLALARDNLFPAIFKRTSKTNTPVAGLLISSALVTILMGMNYTKGLVEQFTFIILLATLTCLLVYVLSAMAELLVLIKNRQQISGRKLLKTLVLSLLAFSYSAWAIAGSGEATVYWGFLLVMLGVPVYVWLKWQHNRT